MKRKLFTQMMHEWRDNIWIMLGLTIVSLAIWFFCSGLFSILRHYFLPLGFDETDVYELTIGLLDNEAPGYVESDYEEGDIDSDDLRYVISRIRNSQNVEAAGFTYYGSPYSTSSYNTALYLAGEEPDTIGFPCQVMFMSPDVIKVLKIKSLTGKDEDWLKNKLEADEILVSPNPYLGKKLKSGELNISYGFSDNFRTPEDILGRLVHGYNDSINKYRVADKVQLVRRYRYDTPPSGGAIRRIDESGAIKASKILIRVKPGSGKKFSEEFESTPEMQRLRNVYLYDLISLTDKSYSVERNDQLDTRLYFTLIGFLLIILFLGLLGTFWFRMHQRVSEIAIRRVCGASRADIFRRVFAEGMILLAGASMIAAVVGWVIIKKTDFIQGFSTMDLLWFELATMALVAIGIIVSISYPAWKAMNIEPAVAVRDE